MRKHYNKPQLKKHGELKSITFSREDEGGGYHREKTVQQGRTLWWNVRDEE